MQSGAAGKREHLYDSHTIVSTCNAAERRDARKAVARRERQSGGKPTAKAGSEACQSQGPGAASVVSALPGGLGCDCGQDTERARDAVCLSRSARFAPRPGPVRGFRKMRRAQWVKLRRVEEIRNKMPRSLKKGPFVDEPPAG